MADTPTRRAQGTRGLAATRAAQLAVKRAQRTEGGASLFAKVAVGIASHIQDDLREGMEFARQGIAAVRAAHDYDPEQHGRTDDEIADWILAMAEKRRAHRG